MIDKLTKRSKYSKGRLDELRRRVSKIELLKKHGHLAIYAVGSYARLEASARSDIDLFFLLDDTGTGKGAKISRLEKTRIDAEIIKIVDEMSFPEFSNDGEYLEIHSLDSMLSQLGGRNDDSSNMFTARLLLLLESQPIFNSDKYDHALREIVQSYFRDYHDHVDNFRPIFLVNDIVRYWKTICLNYEHKRNNSDNDRVKKNKNHLRNFKLKFSRLFTCFSTIIPLCAKPSYSPGKIVTLTTLTPLTRLANVVKDCKRAKVKAKAENLLNEIGKDYLWFLKVTADKGIEDWIGNLGNRKMAFSRAREFGRKMYDLLELMVYDEEVKKYVLM